MRQLDIRPYKQQLRERMKAKRRALPPQDKQCADEAILKRLVCLREYMRSRVIFTFVSTPIEVQTHSFITRAIADGKRVAVPRCVAGTRTMNFYYIDSLESLRPGTFGVLEPEPDPVRLAHGCPNSLCVVPALACDREGYRLGYGGGYYDRFLSKYRGVKICVLYEDELQDRLWHGRYDVPVDLIATEKRLHFCGRAIGRVWTRKQALRRQTGRAYAKKR